MQMPGAAVMGIERFKCQSGSDLVSAFDLRWQN